MASENIQTTRDGQATQDDSIRFDFSTFDAQVSDLHNEMHRFNEGLDLSGEAGVNAFLDFAAKCDKLAQEARAIASHTHTWNGNDYCTVCGADGRA